MNSLVALEVVWTLSALVGTALSVYNLNDVVVDRRVLKRSRLNGLRTLSVNGAVRGESIRLYIHASFLFVGIAVLLTPNLPADANETQTLVSWFIRLGLLGANWLLTYNTYADNHLRKKIFAYAETVEDKIATAERAAAKFGHAEVMESLIRIEETQGQVGDELRAKESRADAVPPGTPGEASDAASRSDPEKE